MKNSSNAIPKLLMAAALLLLATLACSVDLGLDEKPDETELARNVEMTLTAILATEANVATQTEATAATDTPAPPPPTATNAEPPTETSIPTEPPTPTKEGVYIGPIAFSSQLDADDQPVNPSARLKKGITKLYGTFPFSGMNEDMKVTVRWENNGKEFVTAVRNWEGGESGTFSWYTYWNEGGGLPCRDVEIVHLRGRGADADGDLYDIESVGIGCWWLVVGC